MTHILAEQPELVAWVVGFRCSSAQCRTGETGGLREATCPRLVGSRTRGARAKRA